MDKRGPIGFFDSGLGGISVLRGARARLPGEDFLYFGDSLHAPYGTKSAEEVLQLSRQAAEFLLARGAKALVIACNTATSAAVQQLRQEYPGLILVGTEPAIKPAAETFPGGRVLVMATAMTLAEQKFQDLWHSLQPGADIVPVPCTGLMEFVEKGVLDGPEVEAFLVETLSPFTKVPVDAVVLGCTHYPFLKRAIERVLGKGPAIFDSADGVSRQLVHCLQEQDLLCGRQTGGKVTFCNSSPDLQLLARSEQLLNAAVD